MDNEYKISDFFPWNISSNNPQSDGIILCLDNNSGSGQFALTYLISRLLKQNRNILLLSCNHSKVHYESILRRNAYDLKELEKQNKLIVKEMVFKLPIVSKGYDTYDGLISWVDGGFGYPHDETDSFVLVIDDLDAFDLLCPTRSEARILINKICSALKGLNDKNETSRIQSFICYGRKSEIENVSYTNGYWSSSSSYSDLINYEPSLTEYLQYRCDTCVSINRLNSGYTQDVHGSLVITSTKLGMKSQNLLFKALDSGIKCQLVN